MPVPTPLFDVIEIFGSNMSDYVYVSVNRQIFPMSWIWRLLVIVVALTVPASALDPVINTTVLTPKDFTSYHLVSIHEQ